MLLVVVAPRSIGGGRDELTVRAAICDYGACRGIFQPGLKCPAGRGVFTKLCCRRGERPPPCASAQGPWELGRALSRIDNGGLEVAPGSFFKEL